MKVTKGIQAAKDAIKTYSESLKKPGSGKKNIPARTGVENSGKTLLQRQVTTLGTQPPSFLSGGVDKEEISSTLWSHWSGKNREQVKACYSQLEKANGSALITLKRLLGDGNQLFSCQVPGVLIMTEQGGLSDFPHRLAGTLDKVMAEDSALKNQMFQSNGVLKTPVLIARKNNEAELMRGDSLKKITPDVSFYPCCDTKQCSDTSMLTLYINDRGISDTDLKKGLKEGLKKATQSADNNLPGLPDISGVSNWLDIMENYGETTEKGMCKKFRVEDLAQLPDLSKISDWSELDDKFLQSWEIIQKYLR